MKKSTRAWVRKAETDYQTAMTLFAEREPFHDHVCFWSEQSAEKYLKGVLEESGLASPQFENHDDIFRLLLPRYTTLEQFRRGFTDLIDLAAATQYPGRNATKRDAACAFRLAGRVRHECRTLLSIRPSRRKTT